MPRKCSEQEWINANQRNYDWYYVTYPALGENGVELPVSFEKLKLFYVLDMDRRNLTPQEGIFNCYENLFEYFIGRITGNIQFQGRSWLELTIENLPGAVAKTFEDLGKGISEALKIPTEIWILLGMIIIILFLWKT